MSSSFTTGQSELLAADAAPQPELQEVGGAHAPDHQHAQWHNEEADDPQVLLRTLPGEPSALLGRDCHGPFVGSVLRAPYLDGLLRPPSPARLA